MFTLLYFTFIYFTLLYFFCFAYKQAVCTQRQTYDCDMSYACTCTLLSWFATRHIIVATIQNASQYWHDLSQDLTPPQSKRSLGEVRHHVVKSLFFGRMVFLAKVESTTVCTWDSPGPGHKGFPARWSINFAFVAYPVVLWYAHQEPNCRIQEQFSSLSSFGFSRPSALMTPSSAQTINNLNIYYGQIMFNLNII